MRLKRYTILVASHETGATRRFAVTNRALLVGVALIPITLGLTALMGVGLRWGGDAELVKLQAANQALRQENESYRAATGELTNQIASLEGVLSELGERQALDDAQRKAMANLPAVVRSRAVGGVASTATQTFLSAMGSPESTFGVLRDLLGVLESRLRLVRNDADRWQALAGATPSIWPVIGWLNDGFGQRTDPFTGQQATHLGLDISADSGEPIHATADGTVQSAGYHPEFGNLVVVAHAFGLTTRYAHMSRLKVKAGDTVARGDVLGLVGSTGRASGPHLHYEVWAHGRPLNPLKLLTRQAPPR